ncbi:hypothetical protein [Parasphingorhabdus sp.]|uniref:hypothetical protein n=1 Tax=Parasphingorhabdus sp. TaxID=2709688 RepID=UPI003002D331
MREPDPLIDGWFLRDSEATHAEAPDTFSIPSEQERQSLAVGDFAKLVFEIWVDDPEESASVERMWVIVSEVLENSYIGILDNEPDGIEKNDDFWCGSEIPFGAKHIIQIDKADEKSIAIAQSVPLTRWPR